MGHRLKCIIVKHHTCDHDKEHEDEEDVVVESRVATPHGEHKVKFDLPYEQTANALMSAKGYSEYVKKHGYHFTDALAEHVSKMMENANGQQHSWTASQVKKSIIFECFISLSLANMFLSPSSDKSLTSSPSML